MKKILAARSIILVAALLLLPAFAIHAFVDTCRNVTFRVTNRTGRAIDIKKIKYYNASNTKWKTENVKNGSERCDSGQTCNVAREDLGGADSDRITKIKFIYKEVNSNLEHESNQFEPTDPVCRDEKVFGLGQSWALTLAASTTTSGRNSCKDVQFKYKNNTGGFMIVKAVNYYWGGRWRRELISGGFGGYDRAGCSHGETCLTVDVQSELDDPDHDGPENLFDIVGMIAATRIADPNYGSNLGDADGGDITQIKFEYSTRFSKTHRDGSTSTIRTDEGTSQIFRPTSPRCSDGRVYGEGQAWTIGKSKSPTLIRMEDPIMPPGAVDPASVGNGKKPKGKKKKIQK